ncbi:BC1881 family protein [Bacillus mycoides]|uniref:BC1881 family protein n=1 Tax=Bacillus mycoides TaxID=1405 RepID=UPI002E2198D7|nr:BC1881 family protein [Bacillus mycoides]
MINLSEVSTKDLSEELERRQSVITVQVEPYEKIEVGGIVVSGPAIVLINQD